MLPDYLPIVCLNQTGGDKGMRSWLFEALCQKLAEKGVRMRLLKQPLQQPGNGTADTNLIRHVAACDLLVIDGHCETDCAELVLGQQLTAEQADEAKFPRFSCPSLAEIALCAETLLNWLIGCTENTPVWGCVLIGGKSSRMGSPKHLIAGTAGKSWLEQTLDVLSSQVSGVVISGGGEIPQGIGQFSRVDDLPGVSGPMAGISAVLKLYPLVSWIVMACDMPDISIESVRWIVEQRRPGRCAVIPRNPITGRIEPLYGWYDFRSAPLLESLIDRGEMKMSRLGRCSGVYCPVIPANLVDAWRNVNRPEELYC